MEAIKKLISEIEVEPTKEDVINAIEKQIQDKGFKIVKPIKLKIKQQ